MQLKDTPVQLEAARDSDKPPKRSCELRKIYIGIIYCAGNFDAFWSLVIVVKGKVASA